jgi:hypothetical protein
MHPTAAQIEHFLTFVGETKPPATTVVIRQHLDDAAAAGRLEGPLRDAGWISRL